MQLYIIFNATKHNILIIHLSLPIFVITDSEFAAVEDWFQKYMLGSHSFVSAITDGETFWSGLAIFIVSNYTVIVWVVADLILILSARNISKSSALLNDEVAMVLHQKAETGREYP